jgi:N-acetylglutamate synthase-like GNAT family acetyltransferase
MTVLSAQVHIRPAAPSDAHAIAGLLAELGYPQIVDDVRERVGKLPAPDSAASDFVWVAARGDDVVGLVSLHVLPMFHESHALGKITSLVVAASARGQNIGRSLLQHAEDRARQQGATRMEVISGNHRSHAHAFYRQLGYASTEQQRFLRVL